MSDSHFHLSASVCADCHSRTTSPHLVLSDPSALLQHKEPVSHASSRPSQTDYQHFQAQHLLSSSMRPPFQTCHVRDMKDHGRQFDPPLAQSSSGFLACGTTANLTHPPPNFARHTLLARLAIINKTIRRFDPPSMSCAFLRDAPTAHSADVLPLQQLLAFDTAHHCGPNLDRNEQFPSKSSVWLNPQSITGLMRDFPLLLCLSLPSGTFLFQLVSCPAGVPDPN